MKEKIIYAFQHSKNTNVLNTSVIFENRFSGELSFFNGLTGEFDFIKKSVFEELLNDEIITMERCICQGENRYILAE